METRVETGYKRLGRPELLSTLWIFLSLNYILCDVLSNMEQSVVRGLLNGTIAGMELTQGMLLVVAVSLEIPFAMVVLAKVLPWKINRFVNMGAAGLMILYQLGSFAVGSDSTLHYLFFSAVEVFVNALIIGLAIKWKA